METTNRIAKSMQLLMRDQGKTNRELAQLIGVTENHASKIVRGKAALDVGALYQVAHWLGTTTDQLGRGFAVLPVAA